MEFRSFCHDRYLPDYPADYVVTDNREGSRRAVHFLADKGCRRIIYIAINEEASSIDDRFAGFNSGLYECGIARGSSAWFVYGPTIWQDTYRLMNTLMPEIINSKDGPVGILTAHAGIMRVVWQVIYEAGLTNDDNIVLASFDEPSIVVPENVPLLKVVQQHTELGEQAISVLLSRIAGDRSPQHRIMLPAVLEVQVPGRLYPNAIVDENLVAV